jgi:GNAT superfamily N-acetyltransferase
MSIEWTESQDHLDWVELEALYRLAPLGNKSAEHLRTVFSNSRFKCFAREGGRLVAAGRALSDGADCSYICDVAVLPEHQGHGLGREVVRRLVDRSRGHKKIILYSVPGKEGFYTKLGFRRLLTAMAIFENEKDAIARGHLGDA